MPLPKLQPTPSIYHLKLSLSTHHLSLPCFSTKETQAKAPKVGGNEASWKPKKYSIIVPRGHDKIIPSRDKSDLIPEEAFIPQERARSVSNGKEKRCVGCASLPSRISSHNCPPVGSMNRGEFRFPAPRKQSRGDVFWFAGKSLWVCVGPTHSLDSMGGV